ncbi:MAG: GIY-YIG nuclease family protein [Ignavibacteriae bacterium]|nr:GIY-YIG nuclease family protein [Ignavibacteriota bacterium]NOG97763.1 GIY-YIG nuclease family protein [Ignavibacteriota bacterium]
MAKPYTIRLFVPDGLPNTFKIIDKMNWTGIGLEISRDTWKQHRKRHELDQAGVYILIGYQDDSDLPTLYIGQGDGVRSRIDSHEKNKDFWDKVLIFVSSNGGLNRAHITWLEWALIEKAKSIGRSLLDNNASPTEPKLTESEKADTQEFLNEILSVLPLVEVKVFEKGKKIKVSGKSVSANKKIGVKDTIIVPAQEDGFKNVFIGQNSWYAIRIGGGKLKEIKYIAAYQTAPISAVTHYAEVETIEPYGDGGKYKLNFVKHAKPIGPIKFKGGKKGTMQSPRYTTYEKLSSAKTFSNLFD